MPSNITLEIVFILLLLIANGVFAMSELAVVSARKSRLEQRAENDDRAAQTALELANEPGSFLATVQIGITLIGILAGAVGGGAVAAALQRLIEGPRRGLLCLIGVLCGLWGLCRTRRWGADCAANRNDSGGFAQGFIGCQIHQAQPQHNGVITLWIDGADRT